MGLKSHLIDFSQNKVMKYFLKSLRSKWKEINTEGYEKTFVLELSLEQVILIGIAVIGLIWIMIK